MNPQNAGWLHQLPPNNVLYRIDISESVWIVNFSVFVNIQMQGGGPGNVGGLPGQVKEVENGVVWHSPDP